LTGYATHQQSELDEAVAHHFKRSDEHSAVNAFGFESRLEAYFKPREEMSRRNSALAKPAGDDGETIENLFERD